ncbi:MULTISPECIES: hypothetical protein [Bacteroidota]|uniref:hypothetical protein n=1 Tax=Bacteroidota TaxID=976 RepID=UPI0014136463|nr:MULTISPECIES: hypothetical protein [Bacteroidota]MDI9879288.1 hypothetical protein [Flectobacillus longus]NBB28505.1 hypothetical protein [Cellulophaga sp. BC115SP]
MAKDFKSTLKSKAREAITNSFSYVEKIKTNITILDELRDFIPPLLPQEYEQLRSNLLKDGCKDPLLVWETTKEIIGTGSAEEAAYVLVDGHNRYNICSELGINFNVQLVPFDSIKEAKEYMIDLQLGRRNLNPQQASYLRGLRYQTEKINVGLNFKKELSNGQNDQLIADSSQESSTAKKLAEEYNVSEKTIRRDAEFAAGLEKFSTQLRNEVLSGKAKIEKAKVQKLSKQVVEQPIEDLSQFEAIVSQTQILNSETTIEEPAIEILYEDVLEKIRIAFASRSKIDLDEAQKSFNNFKKVF